MMKGGEAGHNCVNKDLPHATYRGVRFYSFIDVRRFQLAFRIPICRPGFTLNAALGKQNCVAPSKMSVGISSESQIENGSKF